MSADTIRSAILDAADLDETTFDVPEWGVTLLLISPTAEARASMIQQFTVQSPGPDGEIITTINTQAMLPALIVACAHDPVTREPVFSIDDAAALAKKNGKIVERVGMACLPIAGMGSQPVESGKDDFSTIPDDGTSSELRVV